MPRSSRGPYAKTAERRATIGSAALEVVLESGHSSIRTGEVAARAGLTAATVTYHFPTRDELLLAALEARDAALSRSASLSAVAPTDLYAMVAAVVAARESNPHYLALYGAMVAAGADPAHPAHRWAREHFRSVRVMISDVVRGLQQREEAHPDLDPDAVARQIVATWDGLQAQWLADRDFDLTAEVVRALRTLTRADIMEAKRALEAFAAEL